MNGFRVFLIVVLSLLSIVSNGQINFPESGFVFDDTSVPRVDIYIDQDSLESILHPSNLESNHEYPASFVFTRNGTVESVDTIGFRLRGNTSRQAKKKSYKVSFNSFIKGQKFHGLEKMNLNGEHNDPAIVRSKMAWDLFRMIGVVGSRSNHCELYINNEYYGLYMNVEHIDEEFVKARFGTNDGQLFKCLYPADLNYKGADPVNYKEEFWGRRAYDLKTNTQQDNYLELARFINILNNTPTEEFKCEIESIFEVETYLKVIAMDILLSNWDGPILNKNNFYLYYDDCTAKFNYIPYDLDNICGIDWFGVDWANTNIYNWSSLSGEWRPIYAKIMAVDEYRDKVSYYFDTFINDFFNVNYLAPYLFQKRNMLEPYRAIDTFANADYFWDVNDFNVSYTSGLGGHVPYGMLSYIDTRVNSVESQLNDYDNLPALTQAYEDWDENRVELYFHFDHLQDYNLELNTQINGQDWTIETLVHLGDGIYSYVLDHNDQGEFKYFLNVYDNDELIRTWPNCGEYLSHLGLPESPNLVINEIQSSNSNTIADNYNESDDWIEIYNNEAFPVNLSNYYLTDDKDNPTKWVLPVASIEPGAYFMFWADNDTEQGTNHTNFKLSKNGEYLALVSNKRNHYAIIDSISFPEMNTDQSFARMPNGVGEFVIVNEVTFNQNNDMTSSMDEEHISYKTNVFPNPSSGYFNILNQSDQRISKVELFDQQGRSSVIQNNYFEIDQSGLYYLRISFESGKIETHKIVVIE